MSQVVGIDLGTTNSCVAVPEPAVGEERRQRLLGERRLRRLAGTLILTDRVKAATVPSAVWVEADGSVVTGRAARQRAGSGRGRPALFFKREMGTTGTVQAGSRELPAEEASAHMLLHLKHMAEELLEDEVGRAVITVPAFFTLNARQATKRAGERAGLEVLDLLLEPVAAALAYTNTVALERPRKFMVYDLGGGTFDVSLVTWDPEVGFQMRSFHGDPLLGGYNFDQEVANWMVRQLREDYDLDLNYDDPGDAAIFARLMARAEVAKHDLSMPGDRGLEVEIVDTTLTDRAGTPMDVRLNLTREEFEQMIAKHVQRTLASCETALAACDRMLEETGVGAMDLSDVIMVGGSSRIPLIAEELQRRFGVEPRLLDPDLCVAAGAALKVDSLGSFGRHLKLDPIPARTADSSIDVGGRVLDDRAPAAAGSTLVLAAGGGRQWRQPAGGGGAFSFLDVPLRPGPNEFTISVLQEGAELERHQFAVERDADADDAQRGTVPDVLPHDISIAVVEGLEVVAASGTRLPTKVTAPFRLAKRTDTVIIELYEGNTRIGEVYVRDLPLTVPLGTPVLVDLAFSGNSTVDVTARIPAGGEGAVGQATIDIPKVAVPGWDDLRASYQDVIVAWNSLQSAVPPDELLTQGPRIDDLIAEIGDLLNRGQDRRRAHHLVVEVETLLRKLPVVEPELEPPPEQFYRRLDDADRLTRRLEAESPGRAVEFRSAFAAVRAAGEAALSAHDQQEWSFANENLESRIWSARRLIDDDDTAEPWDPRQLQAALHMELDRIAEAAKGGGRAAGEAGRQMLDRWLQERDRIAAALAEVDPDDDRAGRRLGELFRYDIRPLRVRVEQWLEGLGKDRDIERQPPGSGPS